MEPGDKVAWIGLCYTGWRATLVEQTGAHIWRIKDVRNADGEPDDGKFMKSWHDSFFEVD